MVITINKRGNHISKRSNCIVIEKEGEKVEHSVDLVEGLLLTTSCSITTDALLLCKENDVSIIHVDRRGEPIYSVEGYTRGGNVEIRRKQLKLSTCKEGVEFSKNNIIHKLNNRMAQLKEMVHNRKGKDLEHVRQGILEMEKIREKIAVLDGNEVKDIRASLQGYEGAAGRIYFEKISSMLPEKFQFSGRSMRPAHDKYNALLNYGYGVLYGKLKSECTKCHLDPYIGVMHVDTYNKPCFVFDVIENFRYIAEKIAVKLCSKHMVDESCFMVSDGEVTVNEVGRKILLAEFYEELSKKATYRKKEISTEDYIRKMLYEYVALIKSLN